MGDAATLADIAGEVGLDREMIERLLAGDAAGFPNGRRISDDVTDIAARVVVGVLAGGDFAKFPHNSIGDGVNTNDVPYRERFPYLGLAHSGRDSRHVDPNEPGCADGHCPVD